MPPPFVKHVFVCTNLRDEANPKGSCAAKGSEELPPLFKKELDAHGVKGTIRINKAGCLDACERGCTVVVYPEGVWYQKVTAADVQRAAKTWLHPDNLVEVRTGPKT